MAYATLDGGEWIRYNRDTEPMEQILKGMVDPSNPEYTAADWISGKEIRISAVPGINRKAMEAVKQGFEDLINELHLDIDVNVYEADRTVTDPVEACTYSGGLNYEKLAKMYATEPHRKQKQHADVVLTKENFIDDKVSWADSRFSTGTAIFALSGGRQNNYSFLRKLAKHEAGHLLGYRRHHDDFKVPDLDADSCVMDPSIPTDYNCDKCFNALNSFWQGLEKIAGKKFIKDSSPYKIK